MMATFIVAAVRLLAGTSVRWVGCPPERKQRVFIANHTSNFDGVVLWAALPPDLRRTTRPVAAHDYWTRNALRRYLAAHVFNCVLIERKNVTARNNPIDDLVQAVNEGFSLILFPEGGRFPGPEPGPFKSGIYHLARKCPQVELVPTYIDNMTRILPKGEFLPVPLLTSVSFGEPFHLKEEETKSEFLERARNAVSALHPK